VGRWERDPCVVEEAEKEDGEKEEEKIQVS
jgi:hypothetical protein